MGCLKESVGGEEVAAGAPISRHSVMLPCSLPSVPRSRDVWPPANDGRPGAPSSLPKTPAQTPFPASRNENYVKRPMLLPCRQRPKTTNSKLSQEAAGNTGKTGAKTASPLSTGPALRGPGSSSLLPESRAVMPGSPFARRENRGPASRSPWPPVWCSGPRLAPGV